MDEQKLVSGAREAVHTCMGVESGEKVVAVVDSRTEDVAEYIIDEISSVTDNLEIFRIKGEDSRPFNAPSDLLEMMGNSDAVFVITDYVYGEIPTFYRPIQEAVEGSEARMAVMVELDRRILSEGMNADYEEIREFSRELYDILHDADEVRVKTEKGTDLVVELGYNWAILDGFPDKGSWVNLPDGEVLTAPSDISGKIVIDGTAEFLGLLEDKPLSVEIEDGRAVEGTVRSENQEAKEKFKEMVFETDENSDRIGEFAIGTNTFLEELCGNLTQDEKFPSVHIAFGDPHGSLTGAEWESELHMDAVILNPTVTVDGTVIMDEGDFQI